MTEHCPIIVIGAARSGTNLLRDIICSFDGYNTWPCDEINYIWRHGNRSEPTDELRPSDATPKIIGYIRRSFQKQLRRQGGGVVVEKTCANSLRVPFVDQVIPEARYVFIVRDGRDVVASAMERWRAELDTSYLVRKARFVPPSDLPAYALAYLGSRLHRSRNPERRLGSWGPRFEGMEELSKHVTLAELSAFQWKRCVELAEVALQAMEATRVHRMSYENLVSNTSHELGRLGRFLEEPLPSQPPAISAGSVGRWRQQLTPQDRHRVTAITGLSCE